MLAQASILLGCALPELLWNWCRSTATATKLQSDEALHRGAAFDKDPASEAMLCFSLASLLGQFKGSGDSLDAHMLLASSNFVPASLTCQEPAVTRNG